MFARRQAGKGRERFGAPILADVRNLAEDPRCGQIGNPWNGRQQVALSSQGRVLIDELTDLIRDSLDLRLQVSYMLLQGTLDGGIDTCCSQAIVLGLQHLDVELRGQRVIRHTGSFRVRYDKRP